MRAQRWMHWCGWRCGRRAADMDFTYYFAVVIGVVTMIASHLVRISLKTTITRRRSAITLVVALLLSYLLLLNWSHLLDWGVGFAAMDLGIIAFATLIGCLVAGPFTIISMFKR